MSMVKNEIATLSKSLGLSVSPDEFYAVMAANCFGGETPTQGQLAAFLALANQYKLNPLTKEIYAFPSGGGITPIIAIDGWIKIAHSSGDLRGIKHEVIANDKGDVVAVKCILARKDWEFYTETTEYMSENRRNTPTWKQYPIRMLKHRATAQAIRMAFNVNAMLEDEYDQWQDEEKGIADIIDAEDKKERVLEEANKCESTEALSRLWSNLTAEEKKLVRENIAVIGKRIKESIVEVQDANQEG